MRNNKTSSPNILEWVTTIFTVVSAITGIIALFISLQNNPSMPPPPVEADESHHYKIIIPQDTVESNPIQRNIFSLSSLVISLSTIVLAFFILNGSIIYALKLSFYYAVLCSIIFFLVNKNELNLDSDIFILYSSIIGILFMLSILIISIVSNIRNIKIEKNPSFFQTNNLTGVNATLRENIPAGELGRIEVFSNKSKHIKLARNIGNKEYKKGDIVKVSETNNILFFN